MKRKKPNRKRLLAKMPTGEELYRIAREVLLAAGKQYAQSWYSDLYPAKKELEPVDPLVAANLMASRFIPYIDAYVDEGGQVVLAELGQQLADDWLVEAPQVLDAARSAALELCEATTDQFLRDIEITLAAIRKETADSIASGETLGETVNRIDRYMDEGSRWRARRIAVTESARAYNQGQHAATQPLDFIIGHELLLSDDACPLCHAIHRICPKIRKGGSFGKNGKNETYQDLKVPPFHPNCRCTTVPIFDDEAPQKWPDPAIPSENGYITPSETDYANAEEGGYLSVAIGNAKSIKGPITLTEVD